MSTNDALSSSAPVWSPGDCKYQFNRLLANEMCDASQSERPHLSQQVGTLIKAISHK